MIFSRDSRSHNRTDIRDRDPSNIYGDANDISRAQNPYEEEKNHFTSNNPTPYSNTSMPNPRMSGNNFGQPPPQMRNPFMTTPQQAYQFSNSGMQGPPSRGTTGQNSNMDSREGARRRMASPAVIFHAFFANPDPTSPQRGFSISREIRGVSPAGFQSNDFFNTFGIFNSLFQGLVGDIFNQESFMTNFHSNFRSSDIFQDIINQSAQAAQEAAKKPTSKNVRKKLAIVKISKKHCKKGKSGEYEQPSCTICICEIPTGERGMVLPCGHIFHPDCINPWLDDHNTCPSCRHELPSEKDQKPKRRASRESRRGNWRQERT